MGLSKTSLTFEIKSDGDTFHELLKLQPHQIPSVSPDLFQGFDLHKGEIGTPGSIVSWNYAIDGKGGYGKTVVDIDEQKRSVTWKFIEGDLLELYKTLHISCHVDQNGETSLVTWTYDFEKLNEDFPTPDAIVGKLHENLTKEIEAHHLKQATG